MCGCDGISRFLLLPRFTQSQCVAVMVYLDFYYCLGLLSPKWLCWDIQSLFLPKFTQSRVVAVIGYTEFYSCLHLLSPILWL
jgi:hypothetical protein